MKQFYAIKTYKQYDRDVKLAVRRGLYIEKLLTVVDMLRKDEPLPANLHNHMLSGDYKGYWECHISPDWLLLYEKDTEIRIISLYRTGTHADIFGKACHGYSRPSKISAAIVFEISRRFPTLSSFIFI